MQLTQRPNERINVLNVEAWTSCVWSDAVFGATVTRVGRSPVSPSTVVGVARNHDSAAVKYRETLDLDSLSILSELDQQSSGAGVVVRQNSRRGGYSASTRRCSPSNIANSRRSRATASAFGGLSSPYVAELSRSSPTSD